MIKIVTFILLSGCMALAFTAKRKPLPSLTWGQESWTQSLTSIIKPDLIVFSSADDITKIRPDYKSLSDAQKIRVIAQIFSSTSKYESDYDQESFVVSEGHKNTWSVGLMQVSVTDQKKYGFKFGYTFADLQRAVPNLKLAEAIMVRQIKRYGRIIISKGNPGVYWSTLSPGYSANRSKETIRAVQSLKF